MRQIVVLSCLLISFLSNIVAQEQPAPTIDLRLQVGISCGFGQPINRVGAFAKIAAERDCLAAHIGLRGHYNFSSFGPAKMGWEAQPNIGLALGFGATKATIIATENVPLLYQSPTNRRYALGYEWQFYKDQIETSQSSGIISIYINSFVFYSENDALTLRKPADKYRTGAIGLRYTADNTQYEIRSVLWHGNTKGATAQNICETEYPCRYGYRNFSKCQYGNYSHGILSARISQFFGNGEMAHLDLGIDSEKVRHGLQNLLIHDMILVPEKWNKARNVHYPMLDEKGEPFLYLEGQKIRKDKLYFSLGLNEKGFY